MCNLIFSNIISFLCLYTAFPFFIYVLQNAQYIIIVYISYVRGSQTFSICGALTGLVFCQGAPTRNMHIYSCVQQSVAYV